jgi:hypothetical protein
MSGAASRSPIPAGSISFVKLTTVLPFCGFSS